jgi:hypothetical protein
MENTDTLPTPDDGQVVDGQAGTPAQAPEGASQKPDVETRLSQIERDYKELQKDYTRKAQQLAEMRRSQQSPQGHTNQPVAEDFDWANPGASIGKYVGSALTEFEMRQEQKRQAAELIRDTAEQHGIPTKDLQKYYQKLQEAATDPYELMETVARMYRADHTDQAINEAQRATKESVERNARAVTAEGGSTKQSPPGKALSDMTDKELEEYVMRVHGKAGYGY